MGSEVTLQRWQDVCSRASLCRGQGVWATHKELALSRLGCRKTPSAWGGQGPMSVLKEAGLDEKGHSLARSVTVPPDPIWGRAGQVLRPRRGPSQNLLPWHVSSRPSSRAVILRRAALHASLQSGS
ncbi:BRD3 opposite strand [Homo sapiens]|uniref:LP2477 n=1 Tax=Homo sapiens TaxID=9606 RepID=Q6XYD6_HUMAN|nr:LP2477 [Homo sapiens]KAI4009048.1 BRD3 opposite strand [Homo sapiens]